MARPDPASPRNRLPRHTAIVAVGAIGFALGLGGFAAAQFDDAPPTSSVPGTTGSTSVGLDVRRRRVDLGRDCAIVLGRRLQLVEHRARQHRTEHLELGTRQHRPSTSNSAPDNTAPSTSNSAPDNTAPSTSTRSGQHRSEHLELRARQQRTDDVDRR